MLFCPMAYYSQQRTFRTAKQFWSPDYLTCYLLDMLGYNSHLSRLAFGCNIVIVMCGNRGPHDCKGTRMGKLI